MYVWPRQLSAYQYISRPVPVDLAQAPVLSRCFQGAGERDLLPILDLSPEPQTDLLPFLGGGPRRSKIADLGAVWC